VLKINRCKGTQKKLFVDIIFADLFSDDEKNMSFLKYVMP